MSDDNRTAAPTGLRRAWLREIGIDHVWALPAPPVQAASAVPQAEPDALHVPTALDAAPIPMAPETAPPRVSSDVAATSPAQASAADASAHAGTSDAALSNPPDAAPAEMPDTPATRTPVSPVEDASPMGSDLYRREPLPDPYRRPADGPASVSQGHASAGEAVYTRVPVTDAYTREPYGDPGEVESAAEAAPDSPQTDAQPWVAVLAPATRPDQEDWVLVGETLDKDLAAPARRRFLTAMLAAQGHAVGEACGWPQAAEDGAAALVVIGEAAMAALAPGGAAYAVGEIAVDGVPLPALLLPSLPQISLNAEGKAATWRGLLRLAAQVNGGPG